MKHLVKKSRKRSSKRSPKKSPKRSTQILLRKLKKTYGGMIKDEDDYVLIPAKFDDIIDDIIKKDVGTELGRKCILINNFMKKNNPSDTRAFLNKLIKFQKANNIYNSDIILCMKEIDNIKKEIELTNSQSENLINKLLKKYFKNYYFYSK